MSKELLLMAEAVSNQKGMDPSIVIDAITAALESATKKWVGADIGVRIALDPRTGEYDTFRYWDICNDDEIEYPDHQINLTDAQERDKNAVIGGRIEESIESIPFGRISAQAAKQVIMQKFREAERQMVIEEYQPHLGELVTGVVKKTTRDNIIIDLGGKAEALLPRNEILPGEIFRPGDRIRAYLYNIQSQQRGPQLHVSRTHTNMLIELFKIEVPEVGEGIIEIKAAAREPGHRSKIAVKTNDGRIDPIGACVGMRGSRVQAVSSELRGERIDIILWEDSTAQLVINAMSPSEINSIVVDEESQSMDLAVSKEFLSQAIGRNGQNVRLASELSGWTLNVMTDEEFVAKSEQESATLVKLFTEKLEIEQDIASILINAGFSSIEELAYIPKEELLSVEEFDEQLVDELRRRANNILLMQALTSEEKLSDTEPSECLLNMEGMQRHLAYVLANKGIVTQEDLAERSVDELLEIEEIDEALAAQLIMKAREPWFQE